MDRKKLLENSFWTWDTVIVRATGQEDRVLASVCRVVVLENGGVVYPGEISRAHTPPGQPGHTPTPAERDLRHVALWRVIQEVGTQPFQRMDVSLTPDERLSTVQEAIAQLEERYTNANDVAMMRRKSVAFEAALKAGETLEGAVIDQFRPELEHVFPPPPLVVEAWEGEEEEEEED